MFREIAKTVGLIAATVLSIIITAYIIFYAFTIFD